MVTCKEPIELGRNWEIHQEISSACRRLVAALKKENEKVPQFFADEKQTGMLVQNPCNSAQLSCGGV